MKTRLDETFQIKYTIENRIAPDGLPWAFAKGDENGTWGENPTRSGHCDAEAFRMSQTHAAGAESTYLPHWINALKTADGKKENMTVSGLLCVSYAKGTRFFMIAAGETIKEAEDELQQR